MIDSVLLVQSYAHPLEKSVLRKFFRHGEHHIYGGEDDSVERHNPRLIYYSGAHAGHYLSVQASLPKVLYNTNLRVLTDGEIDEALSIVSDYVLRETHAGFNPWTANVGRVDYCFNFQVGEERIFPYLRAAMEATPAHLKRRVIGNIETVDHYNKSRKLTLYAKKREVERQMKLGRVTEKDVKAADGVLRIEARFTAAGAVKGLREKLGLANRTAQSLLRCRIAEHVLTGMLNELELDQAIASKAERFDRLRDCFGFGPKFQRLIGFMTMCEVYGAENLVRLDIVERASFYEQRRALQQARSWVWSPLTETLPGLHIRQTHHGLMPIKQIPEDCFSGGLSELLSQVNPS